METTAAFYDRLAPYYHLLYGDWEASVAKQGDALVRLLTQCGIRAGDPVLDAACGIGTQSIGLLRHGYELTASDISAGAVHRLNLELNKRGLHARSQVDDLRSLGQIASESMAAVLACDNSIPHLLRDEQLLQCFSSCFRCLRPGGIGVFSVRDYAAIPRISPDVRPYGVHRSGEDRFIAVQVWEWDGDQYDLRLYLTIENVNGNCSTEVVRSRYYAVSIARLLALMEEAGFESTRRLDDVLFQPVLLGRRPDAV
jgi:SAM-dependent methyltransferase